MAWLNAKPKGKDKSRYKQYSALSETHPKLVMPDLGAALYVIELFTEAGICSSNGMGATPLSWQDIDAWLNVTQRKLCLWEKMLVKELSELYVSQLYDSENPNCAAPYSDSENVEQRRAAVNLGLMAFFANCDSKGNRKEKQEEQNTTTD